VKRFKERFLSCFLDDDLESGFKRDFWRCSQAAAPSDRKRLVLTAKWTIDLKTKERETSIGSRQNLKSKSGDSSLYHDDSDDFYYQSPAYILPCIHRPSFFVICRSSIRSGWRRAHATRSFASSSRDFRFNISLVRSLSLSLGCRNSL